MNIMLNSMEKVKNFVNQITQFESDMDLKSGNYQVDAKSILGIMSLNLSKPLELIIYDEQSKGEIMNSLHGFQA